MILLYFHCGFHCGLHSDRASFNSEQIMNQSRTFRRACFVVLSLLGWAPAAAQSQSPSRATPVEVLPEISVGIDSGDLRGGDHRALQAAVDYVAGLGGGTVRIGAGRYQMRNALVLRSNVQIV